MIANCNDEQTCNGAAARRQGEAERERSSCVRACCVRVRDSHVLPILPLERFTDWPDRVKSLSSLAESRNWTNSNPHDPRAIVACVSHGRRAAFWFVFPETIEGSPNEFWIFIRMKASFRFYAETLMFDAFPERIRSTNANFI